MKKLLIFLLLLFLDGTWNCNAEEGDPSSEKPSLHVFIHVCTINHWQSVLERQLGSIKASGLYEQCDSISVGVLGVGNIKPFMEKYPKLKLLFQTSDTTLYERPTLLCLHELCQSHPDALVLYLHTKGVSRVNDQMIVNINDWSRYMEYYAIERWQDCVEALKENDACGVNWRDYPSWHFSGNFWWASAKYVSTLPNFIDTDYLDPEMWLGQNFPKVKCFQESDTNHYKDRFPPWKYKYRDKQYILALIPGGPFGNQLNNYWNKVKNSDLNHKFVMNSPPLCKLTTNFTSELTKDEFEKVLQDTLDTMKKRKIPKKIQVVRLIQGQRKQDSDYIELNSRFLMDVAQEFVQRQHLPISIVTGKNQSFRINLRKFKYSNVNKTGKIHRLQYNINLDAQAKWSIGIYKLNEEKLDFITSRTL